MKSSDIVEHTPEILKAARQNGLRVQMIRTDRLQVRGPRRCDPLAKLVLAAKAGVLVILEAERIIDNEEVVIIHELLDPPART